ncbi:transcriptional repressor [Sedimentibacter sp.]|uniref:Fur family transcriptional regulator n=1 Tax=Sedimentibacter sp. TaxID=1960295 RepID=UPI0028A04073|nr:transcriptional repressor [Sedimentibacter sp.]
MKQLRNTKQRQTVLNAVLGRKDHPTADRLYLDLRAENPNLSRGTVYRNLNILAEGKEIKQLKTSGADRFDWRLEPHDHIMCTNCGALFDSPLPYKEELDNLIEEYTGFKINLHRTVFEGLCPDCIRRLQSQD